MSSGQFSRSDRDLLTVGLACNELGQYLVEQVPVTQREVNNAWRLSGASQEVIEEGSATMTTIAEICHNRGMAKATLRQVEQKFGSIPRKREAQRRKASPEYLDRWSIALISAENIDAVFDGSARQRL